jgi:hypothetical protein
LLDNGKVRIKEVKKDTDPDPYTGSKVGSRSGSGIIHSGSRSGSGIIHSGSRAQTKIMTATIEPVRDLFPLPILGTPAYTPDNI